MNSNKEVSIGTLISKLHMSGENSLPPSDHSVLFMGEAPCDRDGVVLKKLIADSSNRNLLPNIVANHCFSRKIYEKGSVRGYKDEFEKITTYITMIVDHAKSIIPSSTAQTNVPISTTEQESVFKYADTASSRAEINIPTLKLELGKIAIIGVGGTGSYVLDLVAKTPVKEIHLFDEDYFLSHNAFRAPSAASLEELNDKPKKVDYYEKLYSKMRRGIFPHDYHITESNVSELKDMDFVFLCIDSGGAKKIVADFLETTSIPFIDVGMDIMHKADKLEGRLRVTTSTESKRDHFRKRVSLADVNGQDIYDTNIQVADLNSLNAALAVIKWKKFCGFYHDFENEHNSKYLISTNELVNDDQYTES